MDLVKHASAIVCLAAVALAACSVPPPQNNNPAKDADREKIREYVAAFIGPDMRAASPIYISDAPRDDAPTHAAFGSFRIDSTAGFNTIDQLWVHAVFDVGGSGYFRTKGPDLGLYIVSKAPPPRPPAPLIYPSFIDRLPAKEAAKRRLLPGVRLGMTEDDALASAWGPPISRKMLVRRTYVREEWHYPHGNALYFVDRILQGFDK